MTIDLREVVLICHSGLSKQFRSKWEGHVFSRPTHTGRRSESMKSLAKHFSQVMPRLRFGFPPSIIREYSGMIFLRGPKRVCCMHARLDFTGNSISNGAYNT